MMKFKKGAAIRFKISDWHNTKMWGTVVTDTGRGAEKLWVKPDICNSKVINSDTICIHKKWVYEIKWST